MKERILVRQAQVPVPNIPPAPVCYLDCGFIDREVKSITLRETLGDTTEVCSHKEDIVEVYGKQYVVEGPTLLCDHRHIKMGIDAKMPKLERIR